MELEAGKIVELHHEIKKKRPVIHCITNAVTVNDCGSRRIADHGTSSAGSGRDNRRGSRISL